MFTRDDERTVDEVNTIIGEGTSLKGDVKVEGSIQIDGEFEGTIDATDTLVVGDSGKVDGDANVANAIIGGRMYGNVFASGKIELQRGSQLLGDIKTSAADVTNPYAEMPSEDDGPDEGVPAHGSDDDLASFRL